MNRRHAVSSNPVNPWPVHEDLRYRRTTAGLHLRAIAAETRIQKRYLEAIEQGRIDDLPDGPYRRSFIRGYLEAIGIRDETQRQTIIEKLLNGVTADRSAPEIPGPPPPPRATQQEDLAPRSKLRESTVVRDLVVAIGLLLCGVAVVRSYISGRSSPSMPSVFASADAEAAQQERAARRAERRRDTMRPQGDAVAAPGQSETATGTDVAVLTPDVKLESMVAASPEGSAPGASDGRGVLRATAEVWLRVQSASGNAREMTLQPGESVEIDLTEPQSLHVGNAGGLEVTVNGQLLPPLGASGQVRKVMLDAAGPHALPREPSTPSESGEPTTVTKTSETR